MPSAEPLTFWSPDCHPDIHRQTLYHSKKKKPEDILLLAELVRPRGVEPLTF